MWERENIKGGRDRTGAKIIGGEGKKKQGRVRRIKRKRTKFQFIHSSS